MEAYTSATSLIVWRYDYCVQDRRANNLILPQRQEYFQVVSVGKPGASKHTTYLEA